MLGPALVFEQPSAKAFRNCGEDLLLDCDDSAVRHGLLRPLEIWGVYRVASRR